MFQFIKNFIETFKQESMYYRWLKQLSRINKKLIRYKDIKRDTMYNKILYPIVYNAHVALDKKNKANSIIYSKYWKNSKLSIREEIDRVIDLVSYFYGDSKQLQNIVNKNRAYSGYYMNLNILYDDIKSCGAPKSYNMLYAHFANYYEYLQTMIQKGLFDQLCNIWIRKRILQLLISIYNKSNKTIDLKKLDIDNILIISPVKNNIQSLVSYAKSIIMKRIHHILIDEPRTHNSYDKVISNIIMYGINMLLDYSFNSYGVYDDSLYLFLGIYKWLSDTTFIVTYGKDGTVFFCGAYSKEDTMFIVYNSSNDAKSESYHYSADNVYKIHSNSEIPFVNLISMMGKENWNHIIYKYFIALEDIKRVGGMYKFSILKNNNDPIGLRIVNRANRYGKRDTIYNDFMQVNNCFPIITYNGCINEFIAEINYYYNTTIFIEQIPKQVIQSLLN